jgi:hypothetical protein
VATDIAARGIHVDDVSLVIHADPPIEHKAYLHRSGRTARAGASGTVVTLMTDDQVRDVRVLTKAAGITATTTAVRLGHPLLATLAPGERQFTGEYVALVPAGGTPARGGNRGRDGGGGHDGAARNGAGRHGGGGRGGGGRGRGQSQGRGGSGHASGQRSGQGGSRTGGSHGSGSGRRSGGGQRSSPVRYTTSSGGAAAFSTNSRGR